MPSLENNLDESELETTINSITFYSGLLYVLFLPSHKYQYS
jgi:hypothetical protein